MEVQSLRFPLPPPFRYLTHFAYPVAPRLQRPRLSRIGSHKVNWWYGSTLSTFCVVSKASDKIEFSAS